MKFKRKLGMFMVGVMLSSSISFNVFGAETALPFAAEGDSLVSGSALSVLSENIDVKFNVTGQWQGGFYAEYNTEILPEHSITIGFNGVPDAAHGKPENFVLTYSGEGTAVNTGKVDTGTGV